MALKLPNLQKSKALVDPSTLEILEALNFSKQFWQEICDCLSQAKYTFESSDGECFPYELTDIYNDVITPAYKIGGIELQYCWNKHIGWNGDSAVIVYIAPGVIGIVINGGKFDTDIMKYIDYEDNEKSFTDAYSKIAQYVTEFKD